MKVRQILTYRGGFAPASILMLILAGMMASGCAGSRQPIPHTIEQVPPSAPEVATLEPLPTMWTLDEILGPVSFDPDTVKSGRFDTGRMWTFDAPPMDYFSEAYGFEPDEEWMEHARMSAIRFDGICSSSFVSGSGLVFTNHHCGRDYVTSVTREGENLLGEGFYAVTLEEERRIEGLYVDQLYEITDVTVRVHSAMDAVENEQSRAGAREDEIGAIIAEFDERNGMYNEMVELFNGGRYSVYTYRRYEDVRLVMVPELDIGYFGGDPDNFTYPRYNLDVSFFRVYENDEPLDTSDFFFKWSEKGASAGDPVFVLGNPGSTTRLNTVAQLAFTRDYANPYILHLLRSRMKVVRAFLDANPDLPDWEEMDNKYFSLSNSEKAYSGQQKGLLDSWVLARKAVWEKNFRDKVMGDPVLSEKYGDPWTEIAEARFALEPYGREMYSFGFTRPGDWLGSAHLNKGFLLQQYRSMLEQGLTPDSEQAQNLANTILSPIEVHPDMEKGMLEAQLGELEKFLGSDDPLVKALLGMMNPSAAAGNLLQQTTVGDTTALNALLEGAPASIANSTDPLIKAMDGVMGRLMQMQMAAQQIMAEEAGAVERLARAVYDVYGTTIPPDATFTLRIADGVVTGFPYNGTLAPANTTFYGLYDRWASNNGEAPWELPERWQNPPPEFDLATPLNFISTCDIIGGNSGSPVVNKDLEVVGIVFDGNIESLPGEYIFLTELNRCVSVHSAGIFEVINDLFGYKKLAEELRTGSLPSGGR